MTTTTMTPLDIATQFTKAWTEHDLQTAERFVADDVTFDGPLQQSEGSEPYLTGLKHLSEEITGCRIIAAYGDEGHALLMYELSTKSWGILTCAKYLTIRDGKIQSDKLAFDSHPIRSAGR